MWRRYPVVLLPGFALQGVGNEDVDPGWYTGAGRNMEALIRGRDAYKDAMDSADTGQYRKALAGFLTTIKELPEVTDAWANAATVFERLDRPAEAIALLRTGIRRRKPSRREKLVAHLCGVLVKSYEMNGRIEDREAANEPCKRALKMAPESPRVHFALGAWHAQRLEYPESIYHFEEGLRLQPDDEDAQNVQNLANVLLRSGEGERAVEMLRELMRNGTNTSGVHSMMSTAIQTVIPFSSEAIYHKTLAMRMHFGALPYGKGRRACDFAVEVDPVTSTGGVNTSLHGTNVSMRLLHGGGSLFAFEGPPRTFRGSPPPPHLLDEGRYRDKAIWLISYQSVYMSGRSGTVFNDCAVFTGDHRYDSAAPQELSVDTLKRGASNHVKTISAPSDRSVASALQSKWYNHYHWLCESVCRIVMLAESILKEDPRTLLLVPAGESIIDETLKLLGPSLVPPERIMHWAGAAGTRHFFQRLFTIYFRRHDEEDIHYVNDPWYVYFPPVFGLRRNRQLLAPVLDRSGESALHGGSSDDKDMGRILYVSRNDVGTRTIHGENRLVRLLEAYIGNPLLFFQGKHHTLFDQLSVFRKATVLVGAQGSGLANFIASKPGTDLVLFPMKPYDDNILAFVAMGLGLRIWMVPGLTAFYYSHYNATAHRCKQVLLTLKEVLLLLQPDHRWARKALARPQWAELDFGGYEAVPQGALWQRID